MFVYIDKKKEVKGKRERVDTQLPCGGLLYCSDNFRREECRNTQVMERFFFKYFSDTEYNTNYTMFCRCECVFCQIAISTHRVIEKVQVIQIHEC